jgi:protein TonB
MRAESRAGAAAALLLHAAVLAALLAYEPARSALVSAAPIVVHWIGSPPPARPKLEPPGEPPKPRPLRRIPRPFEPPPLVAAPAEAPAEIRVSTPPSPLPPAPLQAAAAVAAPVTVTPPVFNADYLDNPAPAYPALSRRGGEQGRVILRVLVSAAGTAAEVQLRTSSGYARLDNAAREAVKRWKFIPAKRGSEPVAAWVLIPISFRLEG